MTLKEWLRRPNPDGSRKLKRKVAEAIGVTPTMVTEYAEGRMWPRREIMENIVRVTAGAVTANDFLSLEPKQSPPLAPTEAAQ